MILTHGANSLARGGGGDFVEIGGRRYPVVKIGNQLWMAENLDFKPTGVTVGTNAWYYNNDEQTYGYRGLLYSWNGVSAIIDSNLLPSGWRVPTKADFENLVLAVGSNAAKKLKASSFGGTDDFGFSILNAGYHVYEGFGDEDTGFWTTSNYSSSSKDAPCFYNNSDSWSWDHITFTGVNAISIRLVKSLTQYMSDLLKVKVGGSDYLCKWEEPNTVEIGGREYRTVKIGNQLWMAENLDYKFTGCNIGAADWSGSNPSARYYDDNEASYGIDGTYKCGLLYNWYAAKYLDDNKSTLLPAGWRVPVGADFQALVTNIGGRQEGTKIRSNNIPWATSWQGTNDTGFSALPCGIASRMDGDNAFYGLGQYNRLWTPTDSYGSDRQMMVITDNDLSYESWSHVTQGCTLRLVKDAP